MDKVSLLTKSLARSIKAGAKLVDLVKEYELNQREQFELEEFIKEQDASLRTHL